MPATAVSGSAVSEIDDKTSNPGIDRDMTTRQSRFYRNFSIAYIITGCLIIVNACSTVDSSRILVNVPFCRQEENLCGVSSLEMILRFYRKKVKREEIIDYVHIPALHGTIPSLMVEYAEKEGLNAQVLNGDLPKLLELLKNNTPPIVFFGPAEPGENGHFVVVTGISTNQGVMRIHSGNKADKWMKASDFLDQWQAGRFTAILITMPLTQ